MPEPPAPAAPAIEVRGVSKSYTRDLRQAQRSGVSEILREIGSGGRPETLRDGEFWAVRDVSLVVDPGSALGIVGRNGAGKSTLLRLVAGITQPTAGEVVRRGSVGTLLDPNAGFNPILTGRENIDVAFALLTGRRPEPAEVNGVVAYAGLEDAVDHPVRTYSQGMRLRLGFSVMVHVDPDVLVIDEALAVGDTAFQLQCLDHLHAYRKAGGAIIFASHSLWLFQHLAEVGIHLESGSVAFEGPAPDVADHFVAQLQGGAPVERGAPDLLDRERAPRRPGRGAGSDADAPEGDRRSEGVHERPVRFRRVDVAGLDGEPPTSGEQLSLRFHLDVTEEVGMGELAFTIWTADLSVCVVADRTHGLADGSADDGAFPIGSGPAVVTCEVDRLPLTPGQYAIRAAVYDAPTSDVLGHLGFEDNPVWFELHAPEAAASGGGPSTPSTGLRPLRTLAVELAPTASGADHWPAAGTSTA